MRKKIFMALFGLLALSACGGDDDPVVDPDVPTDPSRPSQQDPRRTVLVYIAAENSLNSFASSDMREMREGMMGVDTATDNLLVYVDDSNAPRLVRMVTDAAGSVSEETVKEYEEQDSATPAVMKTVFKDAFGAYPADSYGLVLWSHGEGWLPDTRNIVQSNWWGIDNNSNSTANTGTYMEISQLAEALGTTVHFDFILFDSCFMLSAEVLYEFKDYADYFIGSPAEIPGPGMTYDLITPLFFSTEADYEVQIARHYYESYAANYDPSTTNTNSNWTAGVAIGAVKSVALPALASATAAVLPRYIDDNHAPVYSSVMTYDLRPANVYYHDLKDFIHQTVGDDTSVYEQWLAAFDEAMVYWGTTPTIYSAFGGHTVTMADYTGGLSIFIPRLAKSDLLPAFHKLGWYTAAGWDKTGW